MKLILSLVVCLWPVLASAGPTYTNADLERLRVPGAYTNEDLRRLPPLAVQSEPASRLPRITPPKVDHAGYQAVFNAARRARAALLAELDYEMERVDFSESAFAGDTRSFAPRLGYRARARTLIQELTKRIALLDLEIDALLDDARRAGALVDRR